MTLICTEFMSNEEDEISAKAASDHPLKTGLWMLAAVLAYYALQAWILPAAGVQT